MSEKWVEIARTGTFTDSTGHPQTFTEADLASIASAYRPDRRDAPLVFGHPQTDSAPAFGWVQSLKAEGQKLFASFAHVPGAVRELVTQGHYRHVSMSLMPDRVTLRHVALLGAAQPAIDGLQPVELADGAGAICVDCPPAQKEGDTMNPEELQRQLGQLQAQVDALTKENAALKQQLEAAKAGKNDAESAKEDAEKQAADVGAEFSAYKGKVESQRRESRVAALVAAGKVTPAEKADVLDFAAKLATADGVVDFAVHGSTAAPQGSKPDFTSGAARASAPQDAGPSAISLEEKYFRDLEARAASPLFADFAAPAPAHAAPAAPAYSAAEIVAKL